MDAKIKYNYSWILKTCLEIKVLALFIIKTYVSIKQPYEKYNSVEKEWNQGEINVGENAFKENLIFDNKLMS